MSDSRDNNKKKRSPSTLAALLKEKPKRGRPPRAVSRQNVYVALSAQQKADMSDLAEFVPDNLSRADLPDLSITILAARLESLRRAVADRDREIPEGITDLESLYLLWDVPLPNDSPAKWTSIRVSPQQAIELGRVHGTLNAVFGATRSQTFSLALSLLAQFLKVEKAWANADTSLSELRRIILDYYL